MRVFSLEVFARVFSTTEAARFMNDQDGSREKKGYEPPKVTVISLRPEEAVLGHCKNSSGGGPGGANCTHVGSCNVQGS
jgi:hypothetical protein